MKLRVEIDLENAAFYNEDATVSDELSRVLASVARNAPYSAVNERRPVFDVNGNSVGYWVVCGVGL